MRGLISHLRYTVRILLKSPGFTITAILILGLGIGANTAIFSLVNGVLLKPLPYPNPDRLVSIYQTHKDFNKMMLDYPDYLDCKRSQRTFDNLTAWGQDNFTLTGQGDPASVNGLYVAGNFFAVLGRPFLVGAPFGERQDQPETQPLVVISEHLWVTRFQRDPRVNGKSLALNGSSFEIVGVTPAQADEWAKVEVYVPLVQAPYFDHLKNGRTSHFLWTVGRLKDGVTLPQASADLEEINRALVAQYPITNTGIGVRTIPYLDSVVSDYSASLWLLEGSVICLLLVTCANVANLLVVRVRERSRDVTIRAALGAGRTRLVVQLLLESLTLTFVGGIPGLALAFCGVSLIKSLCPEDITRFQNVELDWHSLAFVLAIIVCTALAAGLLPALSGSKLDLAAALGEGGERNGTAGALRQRKQAVLVAGQIAITFVLLTAAGLLTRSYQALQTRPLGFNTHGVLTAEIYLAESKYSDQTKCKTFFNLLFDKLKRLPGLNGAALCDDMPFKESDAQVFGVAGQPDPEPGHEPFAEEQIVSPDYFSILGIPLLRGRTFDDRDQVDRERVVIVNESLAQHFFPGQDPIGKQLTNYGQRIGRKTTFYTIIGVVPDIEHNNPELQRTSFQTYHPYAQDPWGSTPVNSVTLVLSTGHDPDTILPALRRTIASIDPDVPISNVLSFDALVAKGFAARRLSMLVVGLFSGTALLLAAVGLYAVLSYSVSQRRRELGVRVALGAKPENILWLVISQGIRLGAIGLVIGLAGALLVARLIQGMLYQTPSTDPVALMTAGIVLCAAALLACLLPALRATRVNPIKALRE